MLDSLVPGATPDSAVFESVNTLPLLLVLRVRAHIKPFLVVPAIHAEPMHFVLLKLPLVNGIVEHQRAKSMQIISLELAFVAVAILKHRLSVSSLSILERAMKSGAVAKTLFRLAVTQIIAHLALV